ncbi:phospholipase DDHD1-like isoform X2 [Amphiura filiformis]|uniref:phospholipase DDHD1-like isoform X2 n=1 Tax=Amphiura filiformis TaxID=82378 RepID=UPI003B21C8B3
MSFYPSLDDDGTSINSCAENVPAGLGFGILDQSMETDDLSLDSDYRPPSYNPQSTVSHTCSNPSDPSQVVIDLTKSPEKSKKPPRPPPPKKPILGKSLKSEDNVVKDLTVPQVRWFYKDESNKKAVKWLPFIGYDSCQLEYKYRQIYVHGDVPLEIERIPVQGGLFEVDIVEKKCYAIYWKDDAVDVLRGTWFYHSNQEPIDDNIAQQIETEHVKRFGGQTIVAELSPDPKQTKNAKPQKEVLLYQMRFKDCHVDWYSIKDVFMYSDSTSSRLARSIGTSIGFSKASSSGYRLLRGYPQEAFLEDKPPPISDLIFVVHGVGQIMDHSSIIKCCKDLRNSADKVKSKHFPDLISRTSTKRAEFLPVEWRTSLRLDDGIVDSITPQKLKGLRWMLNSTGMDVLYYTSPLHRSEIVKALHIELNRLYHLFCSRNPGFEANGGRVSIFAHSLGCVIVYDILTGWNPIHLYDQYLSHEAGSHPDLDTVSEEQQGLAAELNSARKRVADLEDKLLATNQVAVAINTPKLDFQLDALFCVGSPLAVFLALRGTRPQGNGSVTHIMPKSACKRIFNIYHPTDPVAYRLEPLILRHYSTIRPLKIHRADSTKQIPYHEIQPMAYSAATKKEEEMTARASEEPSSSSGLSSMWAKWSRGNKIPELDALEDMERDMERSINMQIEAMDVNTGELSADDSVELDQRIDFEIKESSMSSSYLSALTSHTSYWATPDVALFILTQLFPDYLLS